MIACELQLRPGAAGEFNFSFVLTNNGPDPRAFTYFHPFLDFTLTVTATGRPLRLEEPEYDIAVTPVKQHLPPGQSLTLHTPATLRFAAEAGDEPDQFCWLIHAPPQPITINATLTLEELGPLSCQGSHDTN